MAQQQCTKCNTWKDLDADNFYRHKHARSGFHSWCKGCFKDYYGSPQGKDTTRKSNVRYHCTPEGRYTRLKVDAKRRGIPFELTLDEYKEASKSTVCAYCTETFEIKGGSGLDRIENSLGYTKNNVTPCCWPCNNMKNKHLTAKEMQLLQFLRKRKRPEWPSGGLDGVLGPM